MRIPGLGSIDVDHSGTLMRLRISGGEPDPVVDAVAAVLRMEGYAGTPLSGPDERGATSRIEAWHGTNAAVELSREEARVLAAEASADYARERDAGPAVSERIRRTIGERLYASFTASDASSHVGELIQRAVPAIVAEARAYLATDDAAAFEAFLARWHSRGSTQR